MSGVRRLNALSWFGLTGGPLAWAAMHVFGWGLSEARCGIGSAPWHLPARTWEIAAIGAALLVWALATGSGLVAFLATRNDESDAEPPLGRLHMIAAGSLAVETVFLVMILMTGISSAVVMGCHQS